MTQFNLADELLRGGTGLLAQAVAELVKDELAGDVTDMIEFLAEMERRAAAVPAGNQAKAPTALDEMRALQEGAQRERPPCGCLACDPPRALNGTMRLCSLCGNKRCPHADNHRNVCTGSNELNQQPVTWVTALTESREALAERGDAIDSAEARFEREQREHVSTRGYRQHAESQLAESREALARVEAERDECQARNTELIDAFRRADAESRKLRRELEETEAERFKLLKYYGPAPSEAASEAEVTERAIVVGSVWEHAYHRMRATVVQLTDHDNSVHIQWEDGERRVWPDWQLRAHFTWVRDPEATEIVGAPTERCKCGCRRDTHNAPRHHHLQADASLPLCGCIGFEPVTESAPREG
jgi:hypothetical protein